MFSIACLLGDVIDLGTPPSTSQQCVSNSNIGEDETPSNTLKRSRKDTPAHLNPASKKLENHLFDLPRPTPIYQNIVFVAPSAPAVHRNDMILSSTSSQAITWPRTLTVKIPKEVHKNPMKRGKIPINTALILLGWNSMLPDGEDPIIRNYLRQGIEDVDYPPTKKVKETSSESQPPKKSHKKAAFVSSREKIHR